MNNVINLCHLEINFEQLSSQGELKTLQETASPSFSFANDLIKHNLVSCANPANISKNKEKSPYMYIVKCAFEEN